MLLYIAFLEESVDKPIIPSFLTLFHSSRQARRVGAPSSPIKTKVSYITVSAGTELSETLMGPV